MRFKTKRHVLDGVAGRWKSRYWNVVEGWKVFSGDKESREVRYNKLLKLPKATKENEAYLQREIHNIIGNDSWTRLECTSCERNVDEVVLFKAPDGSDIGLCKDCLTKALKLMR
jgi:hypothetical protein